MRCEVSYRVIQDLNMELADHGMNHTVKIPHIANKAAYGK